MQIKSSGVQAVIHDEDRTVNNETNTDNETDIFISKTTKDKFWNLEYTVLSLLLRHHFNCQSVKHNFLSLADGKLLMYLTNKPLKVKQIYSIEFSRVYQYDQQFRLRIVYKQTRTMSQIDGN